MLSPLEFALELFDYDPDTTPQLRLEEARTDLRTALANVRSIQQRMEELSDDSVYECHCSAEWFVKRKIHKVTTKRIILEPRFSGGKRDHLPRQPLEVGAWVKPRTWPSPSFVFGHALRAEHKTQLSAARRRVHDCCGKIRQCERAVDDSERIWSEFSRLYEAMQNDMRPSPKVESETKVDWLTEGF